MYRDEQDALRARVETLEAELDAERAARVAAEARTRAHDARAQEALRYVRRAEPAPTPMEDIVGWWAKPWIAVAVSAMLALGVYMALRVSQEAARGARYAAAVHRRARCPHRRDTARAYRALYAKRPMLAACKGEKAKKPVWMRIQVDVNGAARIKGLRATGRDAATMRTCLERALGQVAFPRLTQSHPVHLSMTLR